MRGRLENGSLLLARLLLAACFVPSGIAKLTNISSFAVTLAGARLPYPDVVATGCVLICVFGPLALVTGLAPRLTAGALIAVTGFTTAFLHRYWEFGGSVREAEQVIFLAQLGLLAGLLFYLTSGPGAWSWQGWWRGQSAGRKPAPSVKRRSPHPA